MSVSYFWRLTVLAACFAAFGVGGIVMTLTVFPLIRLTPGSVRDRQLRARRLVHRLFATLVFILRATGVMKLDARNADALRDCRHKLVLANHPSYLDVVILLGLLPEADCVVKQGLWHSWFFGGVVRAVGYISNADPDRLVDDCAAALVRGGPLLVFPEGTRSKPGHAMVFQRGAARIILRSGCEVVPVVMHCAPAVWAKGFSLWAIARQQFHIKFEVKSALRPQDLSWPGEAESLAARKMTRSLEAYFTFESERHEQFAIRAPATNHRSAEPRGFEARGHSARRTIIR